MSSDFQQPTIHGKRTLSPIWVLPVLAFALGLWLLYSYIQERGTTIEVRFPTANGIEANKTLVRYQGLVVGQVTKVNLAPDHQSVDVVINMQHTVDSLLREQTQFWVVAPKASLTGIQGLDALFTGNYIAMEPGPGPRRTNFTGSLEMPVSAQDREGLQLQLAAPKRGSLSIGSGVYFQQVQVGEVVDFALQPDQQQVLFDVVIEPRYRSLVRQESRFWNTSGAELSASRQGIKVELESLASLLAGGITFSSPEESAAAIDGTEFALFNSADDANPVVPIHLRADDAEGLNVGTAILYRGLELGQVTQIALTEQGVEIDAQILATYQHLLRQDSQFSRVGAKLGLDGVAHLDTLIFGDFIRLWPGDGEPAAHFVLHNDIPDGLQEGRYFTLSHPHLAGIAPGAPIRYLGVTVGEVADVALAADGVELTAWIDAPHHQLVTEQSKFWRNAPVDVQADLSNLRVQAQPLDLLTGGIAFSSAEGNPASAGHRFALAADEASAHAGTPLRFELTSPHLSGLSEGAPVHFRELAVGRIEAIRLVEGSMAITVAIDAEHQQLVNQSSRFWHHSGVKVKGSLAGVEVDTAPLAAMLRGGLSFDNSDTELAPGLPSDRRIHPDADSARHDSHSLTLYLPARATINVGAPIRYQGHDIGRIEGIELEQSLKHQVLNARLHGRWADAFRIEDARFHLVQPEIGLSGIRNPGALLTGNFIQAQPGQSAAPRQSFYVSEQPPRHQPYDGGLTLVLNQNRLGSLKIGSPVLFRQIKIGEVIATELAADGDGVDIHVAIHPERQHLVNQSSRFWNASGLHVDIGIFTGTEINTESLETLIAGGIAVATEQPTTDQNRLAEGARLPLKANVDKRWLEWQPKL
ncbi:MlaD family protein [Ferrimonas marina]|uniref:Paraquat-inducible protein B n=1 Tax=Ferrimonas marina TaxID=299255 RepID=A0A1M5NHQ9_9GAMM|nr:MlaD family protein [Ferrimonas marina]SHG88985.1 Paraquat-inducible protein B [Ferrimonas marina]